MVTPIPNLIPSIVPELTCPFEETRDYIQTLLGQVIPILFAIIVFVGFLGNMMVIVVVVSNIQMRNTTNILIIALALVDLAFIVFCVPFTAMVYSQQAWPLGTPFCKIWVFTSFLTAYCSVYTLVLMSIDRYIAVVHPIDAMSIRTPRNAIISVIVCWIILIFVNLPLLINSEVVTIVDQNNCPVKFCTDMRLVIYNSTTNTTSDNSEFGKIHFALFFMFAYLLPLIVITILYGCLINRLLFGRTASMAQSNEAMRSKKRVTRMVVIVIVIFAICWLPIHCVFLYQYFFSDTNSGVFRTFHVIGQCLAYSNSSMNPILYTFLSANFRNAFAKFLCFNRRENANAIVKYERTNIHATLSQRGIGKVERELEALPMCANQEDDIVTINGGLPINEIDEEHKINNNSNKLSIQFEAVVEEVESKPMVYAETDIE